MGIKTPQCMTQGRECVVPEVNRNKNIGEVGANMNKQQFRRFLAQMAWNEQTVRVQLPNNKS